MVTPISPVDWQLSFDGEAISLFPSIGNWDFPCRSHYWIKSNLIHWAPRWTNEQIARGRARDHRARTRYFAEDAWREPDDAKDAPTPMASVFLRGARRLVDRIRGFLR